MPNLHRLMWLGTVGLSSEILIVQNFSMMILTGAATAFAIVANHLGASCVPGVVPTHTFQQKKKMGDSAGGLYAGCDSTLAHTALLVAGSTPLRRCPIGT